MKTTFICLFAAVTVQATSIVGTDALVDTLAVGLANRAAAAGEKVTIAFDGSLPAREALIDGKADLAVVLLRDIDLIDKASDAKPIRRIPLGSAAAYVYVHASNPLREISLGTLANLFGAGQRADYKFWSDVPGLNLAEPVLTFTGSDDHQMAQPIFQGVALGGRPFKPSVRQRVDEATIRESLAGRTNAIVVTANPLPPKIGKLLQVSDGREGRSTTAYSADDANIFNGDYPLRLPLVLCVREDRVKDHAVTIRWLLSEEAADKIRQAGMIPAPKVIRDRLAQRLDSK